MQYFITPRYAISLLGMLFSTGSAPTGFGLTAASCVAAACTMRRLAVWCAVVTAVGVSVAVFPHPEFHYARPSGDGCARFASFDSH